MVKEMHYQENTLLNLDLKVKGVKVTQKVAHHVTYAPASLMWLHPMFKEKMHLQENTLFVHDPKVKVTRNVG